MQIAHWSLERSMDRIGSAERKRESPDEDEVAEILETVELTRKVVSQVRETLSAFQDRGGAECGQRERERCCRACQGVSVISAQLAWNGGYCFLQPEESWLHTIGCPHPALPRTLLIRKHTQTWALIGLSCPACA